MKKPEAQHIVIVGGGMVGASLALIAARSLSNAVQDDIIKITLIETYSIESNTNNKNTFDDRSMALSANSIDIFDKAGFWEEIKPYAEKINSVHVSDKGHFGGLQLNTEDYSVDALGYVVENTHLANVLHCQLLKNKIKLVAPATVEQCIPKKQGYTIVVSPENSNDMHSLDADLLVVADGTNSILRQRLGIHASKIDYQQSALIANVRLKQDHKGIAYERFTESGPIALLPLKTYKGYCRASLVWTLNNDSADSILNLNDQEFLQKLQSRFGYRNGEILHVGSRQLHPLTALKAEEQVRSHLAVFGSAAHFFHPAAGQGFNLALRDSVALVREIEKAEGKSKSLGDYSILKKYMESQEVDQELTIAITDKMVNLFSSSDLSKQMMRQVGLLGLNHFPYTKSIMAKKMMGLDIGL